MSGPDGIEAVTAQALSRFNIVDEGCLVAVSGGPDSVALLHAVAQQFQASPSSGPLLVGHLNHGLRDIQSDQDELFVRDLAATLAARTGLENLQFVSAKISVAQEATRTRKNLEETARKLRYAWLTEQARARSLRWILTAHTLNDQAETVLFHILRGTGIRGLCGMKARRRLEAGIWLYRPWLEVGRDEIVGYLKHNDLEYRIDSSNADLRFTRNRIRRELIPRLEAEFNGRLQESLAALADHAARATRLLDRELNEILKRAEQPRVGNLLVLKRDSLERLSEESLRSLFALLWRREGWPRCQMGKRQWVLLARWIHAPGSTMDLPGGIRACKKRGVVQLRPRT